MKIIRIVIESSVLMPVFISGMFVIFAMTFTLIVASFIIGALLYLLKIDQQNNMLNMCDDVLENMSSPFIRCIEFFSTMLYANFWKKVF